ncbi:MAG TPA: tail fiber domain-containing protein [Edaphocola sp.]|nr:tail fiber domain-containing protein [Edaphocola sp.]
MKKFILSLAVFGIGMAQYVNAQNIGINTTTPDPSSELDIQSTIRGFLAPRMTLLQRNAIANPATGLLIYQIDNNTGFYVYDGTQWKSVGGDQSIFKALSDKITYNNASEIGKTFLVNADSVNFKLGSSHSERKLMFLPNKDGAFRAGIVYEPAAAAEYNKAWNTDSIGMGSIALGVNTIAKGNSSTAFGSHTKASGLLSTATGFLSTASGIGSTAMGINTVASGEHAFALGYKTTATGKRATAMGDSTIASGEAATAMGYYSEATEDFSTAIGGAYASGVFSTAMGVSMASGFVSTAMGSSHATGDYSSSMGDAYASGDYSTAMGSASASGSRSTAIGTDNEASGQYSTVMGTDNIASGPYSTAMGSNNLASGMLSTAMGYITTAAGNNSVTIGNQITLTSQAEGALYLSDATNRATEDVQSTPNRFYARFANGYTFFTNGTSATYGVKLLGNGNSWSSISDSTKKENFKAATDFLPKIASMKLGSWNYKGQDKQLYRHYGPMAQEFYKNFGNDGIGTIGNDTTIASADIDGVMMIALQQLIKENEALKEQLKNVKDNNVILKAQVEKMDDRLNKLETLLDHPNYVTK